MKRHIVKWSSLIVLATSIVACRDKVKDPQPDNENEVITTLIINLVDSSDASKTYKLRSRDLNASDGIPAVFDIPELENNKTYFAEAILLDESKAEIDTISNEVYEEADDHQLVYTTNNTGFTVSYKSGDVDGKGYPIGLHPIIRTKNIAGKKVNLQVVLYHLPGIKKMDPEENVKNGSADVDIVFKDIMIK